MISDPAFITAYLSRIHFTEKPLNDIHTLFHLQKLHLLSVPFENLDIHLQKPIVLNVELFFQKLIHDQRGGYCYELNGLFNELLIALGFRTMLVSARVCQDNGQVSDEFDHMMIIVFIDDEKWIADVGFGDFSFLPLNIDLPAEQSDGRNIYRVVPYDNSYTVVQKQVEGQWKNECLFSEVPRKLSDFEERNNFQQTSPQSHFTQNKMITIPTETGRITLTDKKLKITSGASVTETAVENSDEFKHLLFQWFHMELPPKFQFGLKL